MKWALDVAQDFYNKLIELPYTVVGGTSFYEVDVDTNRARKIDWKYRQVITIGNDDFFDAIVKHVKTHDVPFKEGKKEVFLFEGNKGYWIAIIKNRDFEKLNLDEVVW